MTERTLLIVEDDEGLQSQMRWCVENCDVLTASDSDTALELLSTRSPQVMTLDLGLPPDPGGTSVGFQLLQEALGLNPHLKIIVITGREEPEHAVQAIADGAQDFYNKPIEADTLAFVIDRAFRLRELEVEIARLNQVNDSGSLSGLITADPQMLQLCSQIRRIATADVSVAILGETGTGKEVIAKNIHQLSERAHAPFVAINCAAIPENLLESELFGYEKGAFTGAGARKIGKIEAANGGTLFLDEIGDMPAPLQSKILRFLQERSFERLGGNQPITVDVRILSATHQALENTEVSGFREDLYFRLGEIVLTVPPVRDRTGDALLLAQHFLEQHGDQSKRFSIASQAAIEQYRWPGNVRELENRVKRACILCEGENIEPHDLQLESAPARTHQREVLTLKAARAAAELSALKHALAESANNVSEAARLLEVSRPTLYSLLEKFEIDLEQL